MRKCNNCKKTVSETAKKCKYCWERLSENNVEKNKTSEISNWNNPYNAKNKKVIIMAIIWILFLLYSLWEFRVILFGVISLIIWIILIIPFIIKISNK